MSILNDYRRYSDDEEEYLEWKREAEWEFRGDNDEREDYADDTDL